MKNKKLRKLNSLVACSSLLCLGACSGLSDVRSQQAKAETYYEDVLYANYVIQHTGLQQIQSSVLKTYLINKSDIVLELKLDFSNKALSIQGVLVQSYFGYYDAYEIYHEIVSDEIEYSDSFVLMDRRSSVDFSRLQIYVENAYIPNMEYGNLINQEGNYHNYISLQNTYSNLYGVGSSLTGYVIENTMPNAQWNPTDLIDPTVVYSGSGLRYYADMFTYNVNTITDIFENPSNYGLYTYDDLERNGERNWQEGYDEGIAADFENSALRSLFNSVLVSPFYILWNGFNFEIFGVNFRWIVSFLLTIGVCLLVWQIAKRFMK